MANSNNIHIVPHGNQWAARREGAERVSTICPTQHETVEWSKQHSPDEVIIHNQQGQIRERNTYGKDPYPPKG